MAVRPGTRGNESGAGSRPLDLDEARNAILAGVTPLPEIETLEIGAALKRVLANALVSGIDVPDFDNSAMDGYAVHSADVAAGTPLELTVSQSIRAGDRAAPLAPGTAARIFTGAPMPEGANAVIMQEECERAGDRVRLGRSPVTGDHVRCRAHDVERGSVVLEAGHRLRPQDIAIAAATGTSHVAVRRQPRVAVFSTGDELALPGQALGPGRRYTANNHLLGALSREAGAVVMDAGIVPDDLGLTCETLETLSRDHDLLLSSGGASVGDEDHVRRALERTGEVALWRIAVRPGKPVLFGHVRGVPYLGLPGNPVSSFVTFLLLVRPLILALQGAVFKAPLSIRVRAGFDWPRPASRREFVRARIDDGDDGTTVASIYPDQSSDILSSAVWADGLVEIPPGAALVRGDWVGYLPFCGLLD